MKELKIHTQPFDFISILECSITKCVNEHFSAKISGYVEDETAENNIFRCSDNEHFCIKLEDEDGKMITIFTGVLTKVSLRSENGLKVLIAEAKSYTCLLNIKEHIRTFQNKKQTYRDVAEFISRKNRNSVFIYTKGNEKIGKMVVQYEETDWEFLKRMAARLNTVLVSDCKNNNICLCFGLPKKSERIDIQAIEYYTTKHLDSYEHLREKGVKGISEQDCTEFVIKSRDVMELCGLVTFQGFPLTIYKIESKMEGNELLHTYYLRPDDGFLTASYSNEKIIGVSILGKIMNVEHDLVKIEIDSEDDKPDGVARWFQYATVYSSPDGPSWYCMPERKDKIRIYFPDAEEDNAYVISAVHLGAVDKMRKNPDEKSIRTIYNKEIRFTPTKIMITNHKGVSITLDDRKGITIDSTKGIILSADERIEIDSKESILVTADIGISMRQNLNAVSVTAGGVSMLGNNVIYR